MAVVNPPAFLQNAGATHTAEVTRNAFAGIAGIARAASSLVPRPGVLLAFGSALTVTQQGAPAMGITVGTGIGYVAGTEGTTQGMYACVNATSTNVAVTASHASLNRIDLVVFRVYDTQYSGALNQCALEVIAGTPAASPAAPAIPNNSLPLATVAVNASVTTIVNANITDIRPYMPIGVMPVRVFSDLPSAGVADGTLAYVQGEDTLYTYNGSAWTRDYRRGTPVGYVVSTSATGAIGTSSTVFLSVPSATYKANTAYKISIECGWVMSATTNFPVVIVKKTDAAGATLVDFACRPTNGTAAVAIGDEMSRIFTVGGSDVTAVIACTVSTLAGTVTVSAASTRPRVCHIEEFGRAADYPTHPVLS